MYKKILVPLDGSPLAEAVLPHACSLATSEGAELIVLRVAVNPALEFAFGDPAIAEDIVQRSEDEATQYIKAQVQKLKAKGFKASAHIDDGSVADTILETADELGVDVIAMSTHGRTGPARWIMGSVADRVVRNAKVPVLLIRPKA